MKQCMENQINSKSEFPYRSFICYAILALIMLFNIAQLVKNEGKTTSLKQANVGSTISTTLLEKEFVFAVHYLATPSLAQLQSLDTLLKDKVKAYWHTKITKLSEQKTALFTAAAISIYLEFHDLAPALSASLPTNDTLTDLALNILIHTDRVLSEEEELQLANHSFFGRLIVAKRANDEQTRADTEKQLVTNAATTARRYTTLSTISFLIMIVGIILAMRFIHQIYKSQLIMGYTSRSLPSFIQLETFCLYLAIMMALPALLPFLFSNPSYQVMILANLLIISSLLILLAWPASAHSLPATLTAIALTFPPKKIFTNLRFASGAYCVFLPFLFALLAVYSVLLERFGVDLTEASHPLVNVLLSPGGQSLFIYSALLAVVIAPLIEEIMFRGFLYNWLRSFCNAFFSIVISSLIFAILHPQGLLGILPLFLIACMLGFLREWKNDLWINIFTHAAVNGGTLILVYLLML